MGRIGRSGRLSDGSIVAGQALRIASGRRIASRWVTRWWIAWRRIASRWMGGRWVSVTGRRVARRSCVRCWRGIAGWRRRWIGGGRLPWGRCRRGHSCGRGRRCRCRVVRIGSEGRRGSKRKREGSCGYANGTKVRSQQRSHDANANGATWVRSTQFRCGASGA